METLTNYIFKYCLKLVKLQKQSIIALKNKIHLYIIALNIKLGDKKTLQSMYLNLRGIALESDNAVTMPDGKKYDGVKKIFKISDRHPAGIMINGNMKFENIPIENLIEDFRQNADFEKLKIIVDIKNALIDP